MQEHGGGIRSGSGVEGGVKFMACSDFYKRFVVTTRMENIFRSSPSKPHTNGSFGTSRSIPAADPTHAIPLFYMCRFLAIPELWCGRGFKTSGLNFTRIRE